MNHNDFRGAEYFSLFHLIMQYILRQDNENVVWKQMINYYLSDTGTKYLNYIIIFSNLHEFSGYYECRLRIAAVDENTDILINGNSNVFFKIKKKMIVHF